MFLSNPSGNFQDFQINIERELRNTKNVSEEVLKLLCILTNLRDSLREKLSYEQIDANDIYNSIYDLLKNYTFNFSQHNYRDTLIELHEMYSELIQLRNRSMESKGNKYGNDIYKSSSTGESIYISGVDNLKSTPCNEVGNLFKSVSAAVNNVEKLSFISDLLSPSKEILSYMEKNIDTDNAMASLDELGQKLDQTKMELSKELRNLLPTSALYDDFVMFPPFDIVREDPLYQSYENGYRVILPKIKEKARKNDDSFLDMIMRHRKLMEIVSDMDLCPANQESKNIMNKKFELQTERKKLEFLLKVAEQTKISQIGKKTLDDFSCVQFCLYDSATFESAVREMQNNNMDNVNSILSKYYRALSIRAESIEKEKSFAIDKRNEKNVQMNKEMKAMMMKKSKPREESRGSSRLEDLKVAVNDLEMTLNSFEIQFQNSIAKISEKLSRISQVNFKLQSIPDNFEQVLVTNMYYHAPKSWYTSRMTKIKADIEKCKEKIKEVKSKNEILSKEISLKNEQIETIEKLTNNKEIPHKLKELRLMINCPQCNQRRDKVIIKCGHTFCSSCTSSLLSKRTRSCPSCQIKFAEKDIRNLLYFEEEEAEEEED